MTGHQCGRRPASGVHRLSPSTGRQLPSRNQTSAGTTARTETLACDLPVRVRVHAEARAEPRGVVLQQGGSYLASRSGFEGRTRGTRGTNKQPVAFKWTCKTDDTPAGTLFWNFHTSSGPLHAAGSGQTLRRAGRHEPVVEPRACWKRQAVSGRKGSRRPGTREAETGEAVRRLARRGSPRRGHGQFPGRGRQKTLGFGPETGKATAQLTEEIVHVRKVRPELVAVADAAPDNRTFLEKLRPDERAVDFFHAQRGFRPSRATGTKSTALSCAATSAARSRYLRDKATTEPELKVLRRELGFFRKRRRRLREPQGQRLRAPALSVNKVLVNQRMKRTRWSMRSECPHHRWSDRLAWRQVQRTKRRTSLDGENSAVKTGSVAKIDPQPSPR